MMDTGGVPAVMAGTAVFASFAAGRGAPFGGLSGSAAVIFVLVSIWGDL